MAAFPSFDGCKIAYRDTGAGPTVVLLHGSLVDASLNWQLPGVIDQLVGSGFRVVAADARGHGASAKPHDPLAYAHGALVKDVTALIDLLELEQVAVVGYSMGADTAIRVATIDDRVTALVAGGVGASEPGGYNPAEIAAAIRDDHAEECQSPLTTSLAELAKSMGGDQLAYAALFQSEVICPLEPPDYSTVSVPTLIITGADDDMATGGPEPLAARFPSAVAVTIPDQDHFSTVFDTGFTEHVIAFLNHHREPATAVR